MTVFIGTQLSPFWALPENRQELAGLIYGALVSTPAAKHFKGGTDAGGGGMVRDLANFLRYVLCVAAHLSAFVVMYSAGHDEHDDDDVYDGRNGGYGSLLNNIRYNC